MEKQIYALMKDKRRNVAFDLDGVIAVAPVPSHVKWKNLDGKHRAKRRARLLRHYRTAKLLFCPKRPHIEIITARKLEFQIVDATRDWLGRNLRRKKFTLHMLDRSRTLRHVSEFKAEIIMEKGIDVFVEDNLSVLRQVNRILQKKKHRCTLIHFTKKEVRIFKD